MPTINEFNLEEAEKDYKKLTDPSYGGFNLCYNDNYFAQSLVQKWGMSIHEVKKRCDELRKKVDKPRPFGKILKTIKKERQ